MKNLSLLTVLFWTFVVGTHPVAATELEITSWDGKTQFGDLRNWSASEIEIESKDSDDVSVRHLYEIDKVSTVRLASPPQSGPHEPTDIIRFTNGDLLVVDGLKVENDLVSYQYEGQQFNVAVDFVESLYFATTIQEVVHPLVEAENSDVIRLRSGDVIRGQLVSIVKNAPDSDTTVTATVNGTDIALSTTLVRSLQLNPSLARVADRKPNAWRIYLQKGGFFTATIKQVSIASKQFEFELADDQRINLSMNSVSRLDSLSELILLTDLRPESVTSEDFFGGEFPVRFGVSAEGHVLSAGNQLFARGIGARSFSSVRYDLPVGSKTFSGSVGFSQHLPANGSVVVHVIVDKEPEFSATLDRTASYAEFGPLDITKKEQIALVVEFGAGTDVLDSVNWCRLCVHQDR